MDKTKDKKTIRKPISFSPEEAKLLAAGAAKNGLSEAAYIRMLIHKDVRKPS